MLSGNALDWSRKATTEDVEFCLDCTRFENKIMATSVETAGLTCQQGSKQAGL
ncbi:hypothetical protein DSO57_1007262 [Entomophthora muscae]|uniref:Uncharacterized protein n=1 Tax=Entomophthora muscae TaxID=34485 RepID=A0ACC2UIE4_9FUNG|nr:hypothetical protein DSO57_1007262 [Entomophthora muscae]